MSSAEAVHQLRPNAQKCFVYSYMILCIL